MKIEICDGYHVTHIQTEVERSAYAQDLFDKLRHTLKAANFKEKDYSLCNLGADDCLLLCKEGDFWAVSYLERGMKFRPAFFFDIDDAVAFFLWKLSYGKVTMSAANKPLCF